MMTDLNKIRKKSESTEGTNLHSILHLANTLRETKREKNGSMLTHSLVDNIRKKAGYTQHT
jgi:hypothetical protein